MTDNEPVADRRTIRDRIRDRIADRKLARGKGCAQIFAGLVLAVISALGVAVMNLIGCGPGQPEPAQGNVFMSQEIPTSSHVKDQFDMPISGNSTGPGFKIEWATPQNPQGASIAHVLDAVRSRLQHLQTTKLGGNDVAKVLFDVQEIVDNLESQPLQEASYQGQEGGAGFRPPQDSQGIGSQDLGSFEGTDSESQQ